MSVLRPSWVLWESDSLWLPRPYKRTAARTWRRPPQRWPSPGLVRQTFRGQFGELLNLSPQLNALIGNFTGAQAKTGVNVSYFVTMCDKPEHVEGEQPIGSQWGRMQVGGLATEFWGQQKCLRSVVWTCRGLSRHAGVQQKSWIIATKHKNDKTRVKGHVLKIIKARIFL